MRHTDWRGEYRAATAGCAAGAARRLKLTIPGFVLLSAGCGYIGQPLVPLANVPQRISDLAAVQRGGEIVAHCTIPTLTTENNPVTGSMKLELRIGAANTPFVPGDWANEAKPFANFEAKDGVATFRVPAKDWTGRKATIAVRAIGANGKHADWSNFETVPVVAPPETPSGVTVEDTAAGEHITWTGAGDQFRVLRKVGGEKEYAVATTVSGHDWTDAGIEYGTTYGYEIQAVVDAGNNHLAESGVSEPVSRTPRDTFPPAVPSGLRADRSGAAVSLVWDPDSEPDLAGYRIYRSEGNGAWQKVADTNTVPTYSDATAERGKSYRYAVSAFDKTGNESARCAAVGITLP